MKILVVGAGASGLCTAKELLEYDHDVSIVEATTTVGGVFAHSYKGLRLVNNNMLIAFSSYFEGLSSSDLSMWEAERYVEYLVSYAKKFEVYSRIRFSTKVIEIKKDARKWMAEIEENGEVKQEQYDYVVVCTGVHSSPNFPPLPGQSRFKGKVIHGDSVKDPSVFEGQRVVVIGSGEYGADLAYLVGKNAKSITVSVRRWPGYVIPRYHDENPTDLDTSRLHHSLPKDITYSFLKPVLTLKHRIEFNLIRSPEHKAIQQRADSLNLECPGAGVFQRTTSKTESLVKAVLDQGAELKPKIAEVTENGVLFTDGSEVECDYIISCTGYKNGFPFLEERLQAKAKNIRGMAYYMFPVEEDNIAFIGFTRPGIGSIPPMAEMQARYLALLLSGIKSKPDTHQMMKIVKRQQEKDFRTFPFDAERVTGLTSYLDFLSTLSKEIGCQPRLFNLLFTSPRLFFKVMNAFICSAQFRLYGPGANRQEASRIIESLPTVDSKILAIEWFLYLLTRPGKALAGLRDYFD